jgi:thiamine-phosphate pyrophosphorylase
MNVLAITSSSHLANEADRCNLLFENGLTILHLRKPKFSREEMEGFIHDISKQFRNRIVIHGHYDLAVKHKLKGVHMRRKHRSDTFRNNLKRWKLKFRYRKLIFSATFHSLQSLKENKVGYQYILLNNVFSNESKFNFEDSGLKLIHAIIETTKPLVYAVGGVQQSDISVIKSARFAGAGLSSSLIRTEQTPALEELQVFSAA